MRPKGICLHHSASIVTTTAATIDKWHKARGWRGIGYHFLQRIREHRDLGQLWMLEKGRKPNQRGAHCPGKQDFIGYCIAGNYDNEILDLSGWMFLIENLAALCVEFNLDPFKDITYHKLHRATACPGKNLIATFPILQSDVSNLMPLPFE